MKRLFVLLLAIAALLGGWYFASPWWAMRSLAHAAQTGNTEAVADRVDFPALRQSASEQIGEATRREAGRGGILDGIGGIVAERIGREVVNRAITPENIGNVIAGGAIGAGLMPEGLQSQQIDWEVEREGLDSFRAVGTFEDGSAGPILLFTRDGIEWKLSGFDLPASSTGLPA